MNSPNIADIYTEYHAKVLSYITARVNSRSDAEDLCSDVFEKVQLKLSTYDSTKAALGTWIYSITRNCVIDFYRRSRPSEELDEQLPSDDEVDDGILRDETLTELAAALSALPDELKTIIVYRYYDGRPLTEIAKMMGLSYGATKLRHNSALELLRRAMSA